MTKRTLRWPRRLRAGRGAWAGIVTAIGAAALIGAGGLAARSCAAPVDVSGTGVVPGWLNAIKQRDEIAFPAHVALGAALDQIGCDRAAAGLQWVKAGAHARTDDEVDQVAGGLARVADRAPDRPVLAARLCAYLRGAYARPEQAAALNRAGLACPGIPTPIRS